MINSLPKEIILNIFSYIINGLNETPHFAILNRVCKLWEKYSEDNSLWEWRAKALQLNVPEKSENFKALFISRITDWGKMLQSCLTISKQISNIKQPTFHYCTNADSLNEALTKAVASSRFVETLLVLPAVHFGKLFQPARITSFCEQLLKASYPRDYAPCTMKEYIISWGLSTILKSHYNLKDIFIKTFPNKDFFKFIFFYKNCFKYYNVNLSDWEKCGFDLEKFQPYQIQLLKDINQKYEGNSSLPEKIDQKYEVFLNS